MKSKLLVLFVSTLLTSGVFAQEIWFDADFNTTEWLDAFADFLTDKLGEPTDLRTAADNTAYDLGTSAEINGFIFNGPVRRQDPAFTSVCGRTFNYCFRMRNGSITFIEFPDVANAGKINVYARNENATDESFLNLQTKDEGGNWDNNNPIVRWTVPGNENYEGGASDIMLTHEINSAGPIELRLHRNQARFLQIYRITLEQFDDLSTSVDNGSYKHHISMNVINKMVYLSQVVDNAVLTVYDISSRKVFQTDVNTDRISLPGISSGIYILKLKVSQDELTKKVVIN